MDDVPTMDNDHSNQKHESIASSQSDNWEPLGLILPALLQKNARFLSLIYNMHAKICL